MITVLTGGRSCLTAASCSARIDDFLSLIVTNSSTIITAIPSSTRRGRLYQKKKTILPLSVFGL
ncbi:MAG: hypothetical protein P8X86_16400 [Desulfofustis sp.]